MNELMDNVDNLINELESSNIIIDLKEALKKVKKDKELCSLIETYQYDKRAKEKILDNKTFQEFKIKESELNLFIMELNQKLKKISNKRRCQHESN